MERPQVLGYGALVCAIAAVALAAGSCSKKRSRGKAAPTGPAITQVIPDRGPVTGADQVTIFTVNFQDDFTIDVPEVFFGTDPAVVTPLTASAVTAATPPHGAPEAVDVEIQSTGAAESATLFGGFTYTAIPCTVTWVTPLQGSTLGGETVTIDGSGFDEPPLPPPTVEFGQGNPSPDVVALSDTRLEVWTPAGPPGLVDIIVTTQAGPCTLPSGFEYLTPGTCALNWVMPNQDFTFGGATVLIDGMGFDVSPPPTVEFGSGNPAPTVIPWSDTQLEVIAPPGPTGLVDVIVTNQTGLCVLPDGFQYVGTPSSVCTVAAVTPAQGAAAGGTVVVVTGTDFDIPPASRPTVEFGPGNMGRDYANFGPTSFQVTTPPGAPGLVDVVVTGLKGVCVLPGGFEYLPPPPCSIFSVDPVMGPEQGGVEVTILGSGFTRPGLSVWFGSTEALDVVVIDETELRVIAPPGTGFVDVTVDLWGWTQCTLPLGYEYLSCGGQPCQLSRLRPDTGGVGEIVEITGQRFEPGSIVFFGGAQALILDETGLPRKIVVEAPEPVGADMTVDVQVIHPSGVCCSQTDAYTYGGCTLLSLSRTKGPEGGGQPIAIFGSGFSVNPPPEVWFGSQQCTFVLPQSSMELIVMTPPAEGQDVVDVKVINPDGGICVCPGCYDYYYGCTIDSIVPSSGGTNGGNTIIITGSEFDTQIIWVQFGDIYADLYNVIMAPDGTQLTFRAPPSYTGGPKNVGISNETLMTQCTAVNGYDYILPGGGTCTITSIDPGRGGLSGGEAVTIRGSGFDPGTGVIFDVVASPQVTFISQDEIVAIAPAFMGRMDRRDEVPVDVVVAPENQDPALEPGGYIYEAPPPPTCGITGLSESFGPVAGGNTITVTGVDFSSNNPTVSFFDQWGATTFIDSSTLSVVVPPSPAGPVTVDVYYFDDDFCYTLPGCVGCYTYQ